jgi:amidase
MILLAIAAASACTRAPDEADLALLDLDAPALATEIAAGRVSAERLTRASLARIAALDDAGPKLNAVVEINPEAIEIARELDRRFAAEGPVGPLHGIPVVLKASIDTADAMATSAGSLALAAHHATADAELVTRLRAAGAVILAKANLSEWANFRSIHSTSGWSSLGGQTRNPYVLDRNPCGSSSGSAVAVAAGLVPLAVGTETDGSIVCPAGANGVVGIKPTLGLVSQHGIIPIAASQDTAGPMARTVAGAAMLLAAMQSVPPEPGAYATTRVDLRGLRLGIVRDYYGAGGNPDVEAGFTRWLELLGAAGAELVDPIEVAVPRSENDPELQVLLHEFRAGIEAYLAGVSAGPGSLEALIDYNSAHAAEVMPHFGQDLLEEALGALDEASYRTAFEDSNIDTRARLDALFAGNALDALVVPTNSPAWKTDWVNGDSFSLGSSSLAAVSGYPSVAVPGGLIRGLPVGVAFIGRPQSEALLIEIAAVFERARGPLARPEFVPSLEETSLLTARAPRSQAR